MSKPVLVCWSHDERYIQVRWSDGAKRWHRVENNKIDLDGCTWTIGTCELCRN